MLGTGIVVPTEVVGCGSSGPFTTGSPFLVSPGELNTKPGEAEVTDVEVVEADSTEPAKED